MKHTLIALVIAAAASLSACSSAPKNCPAQIDGKSVKTVECSDKSKSCKSKKDCGTKKDCGAKKANCKTKCAKKN